jgi:hypothetical protein
LLALRILLNVHSPLFLPRHPLRSSLQPMAKLLSRIFGDKLNQLPPHSMHFPHRGSLVSNRTSHPPIPSISSGSLKTFLQIVCRPLFSGCRLYLYCACVHYDIFHRAGNISLTNVSIYSAMPRSLLGPGAKYMLKSCKFAASCWTRLCSRCVWTPQRAGDYV